MKELSITNSKKWLISGLFVLVAIVVTLAKADVLSAHPPLQEGTQPDFVGVVQTSPDGSATIQSRETQLDPAYFAENGHVDGLVVTSTGLSLAEGEAEGRYTSGVIHSPLAFTTDIVPLWAVNLPQDTEMQLETRLSRDGGASWSEWLENPEAFYPVRDELHSGHLIWAGSDQATLQFRVVLRSLVSGVSPGLSSVTLVFSDTSQGPTDGEIASQMASISSAVDVCPVSKPAVVSRTDWGCPDGQRSRRPPVYQAVTHVIIHQTETPNDTYPYQDWAGWVRSVWNFHANVLWWGDVGYNYLIAPNGTIYEGRAGGDDVVGIHDRHNFGSMAIGFIGCYGNCDDPRLSTTEPSQAMLDSAIHLMAWKLDQKGIDPLSSATYDGLYNIPVIAGGRDVTWTSSPGDNLYNKLPELRNAVAEKVKCEQACQVTGVIFDKELYEVGDPIHMTVRLADYRGTPLVGAEVVADVTRRPLEAQAATGFGLVDRIGEYDGVYRDTEAAGYYDFTFTATDPTGERFLTCTKTATVLVGEDTNPTPTATPTPTTTPDTPTPTPTPTPTHTPTPTPTPTLEPDQTVVKVDPESLVVSLCSEQESMAIQVENVTSLAAVQLEVTYDPDVIEVIDANDSQTGVQVKVDEAFADGFIALNNVDTANGRISFAATLLGSDKIDGDTGLITIDWRPQKAGVSAVTLEDVILANTNGQSIEFTSRHGTVEVTSICPALSGIATLQGRSDHSGVVVSSSTGEQTQTRADGAFFLSSGGILSFEFPGYLSAQADPRVALELASIEGQATSLGIITLLAGDINGDNVINIFDLAYIAKNYQSADSTADLNADGVVNILDLAMAANNYQQQGPLTNWQ